MARRGAGVKAGQMGVAVRATTWRAAAVEMHL